MLNLDNCDSSKRRRMLAIYTAAELTAATRLGSDTCSLLASYCYHRDASERNRRLGFIAAALTAEGYCKLLYRQLPAKCRW